MTDGERPNLLESTRGQNVGRIQPDKKISQDEFYGLLYEGLVYLFGLIALILNSIAVGSCHLLALDGDDDGRFAGEGRYGLFHLQTPDAETSTCRGIYEVGNVTSERYPDYSFDPSEDQVLAFAQAGGVLALILGAIYLINVTIRQFFEEFKFYGCVVYMCGAAIQVSLGWVHLIWWSKGCDFFHCSYGGGTNVLILCHICWLVVQLLIGKIRPSNSDRKKMQLALWSSLRRLQSTERERRYTMEYLPVGVFLLIIALFLYLGLHNVNDEQ